MWWAAQVVTMSLRIQKTSSYLSIWCVLSFRCSFLTNLNTSNIEQVTTFPSFFQGQCIYCFSAWHFLTHDPRLIQGCGLCRLGKFWFSKKWFWWKKASYIRQHNEEADFCIEPKLFIFVVCHSSHHSYHRICGLDFIEYYWPCILSLQFFA